MKINRNYLPRPGMIGTAILYCLVYGAATYREVATNRYLYRRESWGYRKLKENLTEWYSEQQISHSLNNLEKRGLILREGDLIRFNQHKIDVLHRLNVENLQIKRRGWDHKWRIVVFDIPERHRLYRDLIRRKLIEIGAVRVQKSVWITPVDIQDFIDYLRAKVELGDHVQLIEATSISNQRYFLKKFKLD